MANKVLLKKSSTAAKVPVVGDLDYGELALNYTDGKLYYKTASNTIDSIPSITATATLTNKTISLGSNNVTGTLAQFNTSITDANIAAETHKYHEFTLNSYYYDSYSQERYFRLFTQNATYDTARYSAVTNVEYWNGTAWVSWVGGDTIVKNLLDGRDDTYADIDHTHRKFRFTINKNSGWPTNAIIATYFSWFGNGWTPYTLTIEDTADSSTWTTKETLTFGNGTNTNADYGWHAFYSGNLHNGRTLNRITYDITDWTDSGSYLTKRLYALSIFSNYGGASDSIGVPVTWNYDKVVNFSAVPTVSSVQVATLTAAQTLTNKTLTSPTITSPTLSGGTINNTVIGGTTAAAGSFTTLTASSNITATGDVLGQYLRSTNSNGDEGGEILLYKPVTNSTIAGTGVTIDVYQNKLRIFEQGGDVRGVYIDITAAGAGVATNLIATAGGGTVTSITAGTGLSGGTITTSGTIAIDSTVTTLTGTQTLTNKTLTFPVINNIKEGYTTTATAAGTTTLTSSSNHYQRFTGSTTQTIVLPVTSTLATGVSYVIENASTGNLTVNSSGGNLVITIIPGVTVQCMCIGTSLTTAADWDSDYTEFASITGTGSSVLSASPALTGTATFANATSSTGFLALGTASVTTNRIYATNGAGAASILGNNTFNNTSGMAGVSGTTSSAGSGHLGYFNGTVRAGVFGQIGNYDSNVTTYAGYFSGRVGVTGNLLMSGSTSGTITLAATAIAGTNTLTLPAATDTLVGKATTDTLTNKTLTLPTIGGTGAVFSGSISGSTTVIASAAAGTTTLTLPAATDTLVGTSTTDTLTNKTISSAILNGTLTAGGSAGTNGYYLQTTGSGVQWAEVSSSSVIGYNNSTVSAFPSGDLQGVDAYVGHSGAGTDAFGVSILTIFTCMDPVGSTQTTDLGVLT